MSHRIWQSHLIGGALLAATLGAGVVVGVLPELDEKEHRRQLDEERSALQQELDLARQQQRALREQLVELQDLGAGWASERAVRGTLNNGMARIGTLAAEREIRITAMSASEREQLELFEVTPIALEGEGGFDDVALFMSDLVEAMPNVTVERVDMRANGTSGPGSFSMGLAWYSDVEG